MSDAEVRRIARMARLRVDDGQVESLRTEFCKVLGWAAMLKEVDAEDLSEEPHREPHREQSRVEPDEPGRMLDRAVLEGIAPALDGPYIRVPKVLGGGGGA